MTSINIQLFMFRECIVQEGDYFKIGDQIYQVLVVAPKDDYWIISGLILTKKEVADVIKEGRKLVGLELLTG